jgi:hypothetical protein
MALWVYEQTENPDPMFVHGFHLDLNITNDVVTINDLEITWSTFANRSDFYEMSRFVFPTRSVSTANGDFIVTSGTPFNLFGMTKATSLKPPELARVLMQSWPIQCITYPETTNFSNALWLATVDSNAGITCNIEAEQVLPPSLVPMHGSRQINWSPKCVTSGPSTVNANETIEIDFEYRDRDDNFVACNFATYIKTNAGYLPKNVINVVDGRCKAKVSALGLSAGDTIDVKFSVGKVYTSAVVHTLTVT